MVVCVSTETPEKGRIYHKAGCMYARRIKEDNKLKLSVDKVLFSTLNDASFFTLNGAVSA